MAVSSLLSAHLEMPGRAGGSRSEQSRAPDHANKTNKKKLGRKVAVVCKKRAQTDRAFYF